MDMVLEVTVAIPELKVSNVELPPALATVAVTVAAVLNSNPAGAVKIIVPVPISRLLFSVIAGPVSAVYAPVPAADVSAEKLVLTLVIVTLASARLALLARANRPRPASRNILIGFISGIGSRVLIPRIFKRLAKPRGHFAPLNFSE
jgi:hypothetical protein